jgi:hypothetical protein
LIREPENKFTGKDKGGLREQSSFFSFFSFRMKKGLWGNKTNLHTKSITLFLLKNIILANGSIN